MSKLEELIQKLCPNGVEYKTFEDFSIQLTGMSGVSNKWAETGNCVFIDYMNAYTHLKIDTTLIKKATVKNLRQTILQKGDILFTSASEVPDECAISSVIENDIQDGVFLDDHLFGIRILEKYRTEINSTFLNYYFRGIEFRKIVQKAVRGVTRFYISKKDFMKIKIPIPPIEVQEEIVRILDKFTELSAELTAELTARKKQYEFYRDKLILEQENVEYKTLGEIATEMYRGSGIKRDELTPEGISCVRYGEIYTTYDVWFDKCVSHTNEQAITSKKYFENGDILFAITGESVEEIAKSCAYTGNNKCLAGGDIVVMKHKQNPKYLAYALSTTDAQRQKSYGKIKSKVVHASVPSIKLISIPLPPLAVQEKIASILDNFHSLVTDISEGLPAEIEARQKQYEYYRDKLLNFKEIAQ